MRIVEAVFVAVGLGLLGGSAAWYHYDVQRPLTWPQAEATVVSSRVINPSNPNQHSPEIVLRLADGGAAREVTVRAGWNSSSYDMVRSYVDRYPAGAVVPVAINPADAADVRYELGPTFTNLLGPGIVGIMGVLFAGIGLWVLLRPRQGVAASEEQNERVMRRVAWLFAAIGAGILLLGIWLVTLDVNMLRTWMPVEAESIAVRPVSDRSSVGNRPSTLMYDVQVTFRYSVAGRTFESQTTSGLASSSTFRRDELMRQFAPGTRHQIHHRPDDANVIRYNLTWSFRTFVLSGGIVLMGVVFLAFGLLFLRLSPRADQTRANTLNEGPASRFRKR